MKRILLVSLFLVAAFWGYEKCVDSFYESAIHLQTWPKKPYTKIACRYSPEQVREVLSQPFTYLGKGRQFFVFASQDGKYVLKFIKCQRIDLPFWVSFFSDAKLAQRQERVEGIFASCLLATQVSDNTGVVFAHLNTNQEVEIDVLLIDKLGMHHTIAIDEVPFVLQERAEPVLEVFAHASPEEKKRRYNQLVDLIRSDAAHHIYDKDEGMIERNNVGFLQDRAIHIDIGTLEKTDVNHTQEQFQERFQEQLSRLQVLRKN